MKNNIQSIERAFQILQTVHQRTAGVGVGELAEATQLHTSTVSRIASTLEQLGALKRIDGKLVIGEKIFTLASQTSIKENLISVAKPVLRQITAETGEAVGLTVIEGRDCVIFYQTPGTHHVQIRDWTGERFPLHVTSTGKLYLARLPENKLINYFSKPLDKLASATKTSESDLRAELPQVQREQVAWTIDELEDGLTSVAAAVTDKQNRFLAGLYLSIPNYRLKNKQGLAKKILVTAELISGRLR